MNVVKTDSLGVEILNSIAVGETNNELVMHKTKEEATKEKDTSVITLFEVYENEEVVSYFVLETETYNNWIEEYQIEGVEL